MCDAMYKTRYNLCFEHNIYTSNINEDHYFKYIIKYFIGTKNIVLVHGGDELVVHGYLDYSFQKI